MENSIFSWSVSSVRIERANWERACAAVTALGAIVRAELPSIVLVHAKDRTSPPVTNQSAIRFNGHPSKSGAGADVIIARSGIGTCDTEGKPYTLVLAAVLEILRKCSPNDFTYTAPPSYPPQHLGAAVDLATRAIEYGDKAPKVADAPAPSPQQTRRDAINAEGMPTDKTAEALRILAEAFGNGGAVNADKVREIVTAELAKLDRPRTIEIKIADKPIVPIDGDAHHMLPTVLAFLVNGVHTMIVGPAGSGKTTLAMQCAKQMNLDFYAVSSIKQEYKLLGFTDAKGITHSTQFRKACEFGGLLLWDEIDASNADVLPIVHSAMENGFIDFPDCRVAIHKDFICLAAANTFGHGATRQYIGRNALDGATLDRYAVLDMGYDETLERKLAQNDEWTKLVQKYRHACDALGIKHIISPRASIKGARLLAAGIDRETVLKAMVWKGLAAEQVQKIIANARS